MHERDQLSSQHADADGDGAVQVEDVTVDDALEGGLSTVEPPADREEAARGGRAIGGGSRQTWILDRPASLSSW